MNILGEKLPESAHYYPHLLPIDLQREYNGTDETQSSWRGGGRGSVWSQGEAMTAGHTLLPLEVLG